MDDIITINIDHHNPTSIRLATASIKKLITMGYKLINHFGGDRHTTKIYAR